MAGKISNFLREYEAILSIFLTVLGLLLLLNGALGMWARDFLKSIIHFSNDYLEWSLYLLMVGGLLLIAGIWYLYSYLKNKRFLLKEIKTNKRSEFLKMHVELNIKARHLPSKYQNMLKEKETELKIK